MRQTYVALDIETTGLSHDRDLVTVVGLYDGRRARVFVRAPEEHILGVADGSRAPVPEEETLNGRLSELVGLLPPVQRLVYVLRDLHELNIREVMTVTGLPEHSVKTNLFHARRRLRQELETLVRG